MRELMHIAPIAGAAEGSSFWGGGKSVKHTPTSLILVHTILCSCTFARTDKNHGKYKKSTDEQNCQNICFLFCQDKIFCYFK